jgi:serine/threonine protein kinase
LTHEYRAYAALVHHRISVPPSSAPLRPAVPYCYGIIKIRTPDQLFRNCSSAEYQLFKNLRIFLTDRPLCGLVLEYIPNAASIAEDPSRLTPQLAFRAVQALREIHKAGVLHVDHWPRNIVIDGQGRVRWVDFDSAVTRGYWKIDERCFWMEAMGTLHTLLEDVIPARERGEQPQWEMFSF